MRHIRLRKMAAVIIMGVLLITTLGLTGCGIQTKRNLKKVLEKALQERYNEEFVCLNVWANGGPSILEYVIRKITVIYYLKPCL